MKEKKYLKRALILNPLVLILYGIACFYLAELARYGGIKRRVPIILFISILLIIWFVYSFFKIRKQKNKQSVRPKYSFRIIQISKWWFRLAVLIFFFITLYTGYDIYESSIPYNGKLSWMIQRVHSEKEIPFTHNNIYNNGLHGLLEDVSQKIELPEELYIADDVSLSFTQEGQITKFYGFLYGKNTVGETETFLLSYDEKKDQNLQIYLDNYLEATYDKDKLFQPLIDGLEAIPLEDFIKEHKADLFELNYAGFEISSNNTEWKNRYYNEEGILNEAFSNDDVIGYSFKIQEATKLEASHLKFNFVFYDPVAIEKYEDEKAKEEVQEADPNYFPEEAIAEEYFLNEKIGYQLVVLDATLGTRFYGLRKTEDGGDNWTLHNENPFHDRTGAAAGLTFIDDELGFIALSHNGASEADLFRTIDGGETFEQVEIPPKTVTQNGMEFEPFDFPEMPFDSNGKLILYVHQGSDGDYQKDAKAVYISKDRGKTFEFQDVEY